MKKYNIIEFGAIADNKTINTRFIQRALDQCKRGDEVIIPRGIFLTGALFVPPYLYFKFANLNIKDVC